MSEPGMIGQQISGSEYEGQIEKMVGLEDRLLARKRFTRVICLSFSPKRAKSQNVKLSEIQTKKT